MFTPFRDELGLELKDALEYAIQISEALEHAHQQGIIHHDLKPRNIMLTKTGVKLLDFGIAEWRYPGGSMAGGQRKESMTLHTTSGTLAYMAPEQIEGRETDARTDIFAFGAVTYEMIMGRPAFQSDSQPGLISSIINGAVPAISNAGVQTAAEIERVISRCMAKDPSQRWQSISDVLLKLKAIA